MKIKFIIIILLIFCCSCYTETNKNKKLLTLYNNERLLIGEDRRPGIEDGDENKILKIENISDKYQNKTKEMEAIIIKFLSNNIDEFKKLHLSMLNKNGELIFSSYRLKKYSEKKIKPEYKKQYKKAYESFQYVKIKIENNILKQHDNTVRVLIGYWESLSFEFAKEIKKDLYARIAPAWRGSGLTLLGDEYLTRAGIIGEEKLDPNIFDEYGALVYDKWYYETNLKIRIVKQIRDEEGRYYGEFAVDFYKLDKYDELFDEEGNPKVKK